MVNKISNSDDRIYKSKRLRIKNLLNLTIQNDGTKDITVNKGLIKPGGNIHFANNGNYVYTDDFEANIICTGVDVIENNVYILQNVLINDCN